MESMLELARDVLSGREDRIDPEALASRGLAYREGREPKHLAAAIKAGTMAGPTKLSQVREAAARIRGIVEVRT